MARKKCAQRHHGNAVAIVTVVTVVLLVPFAHALTLPRSWLTERNKGKDRHYRHCRTRNANKSEKQPSLPLPTIAPVVGTGKAMTPKTTQPQYKKRFAAN